MRDFPVIRHVVAIGVCEHREHCIAAQPRRLPSKIGDSDRIIAGLIGADLAQCEGAVGLVQKDVCDRGAVEPPTEIHR